jgi:hypothetical protein
MASSMSRRLLIRSRNLNLALRCILDQQERLRRVRQGADGKTIRPTGLTANLAGLTL